MADGPAMAHSVRERYVPAAALQKCRNTCAALAERLLRHNKPQGSEVQGSLRVVADFRLHGARAKLQRGLGTGGRRDW